MPISLGLGFAPFAWAALHFRDSNLLWLSMVGMMAGRAATLGFAARRYLRVEQPGTSDSGKGYTAGRKPT